MLLNWLDNNVRVVALGVLTAFTVAFCTALANAAPSAPATIAAEKKGPLLLTKQEKTCVTQRQFAANLLKRNPKAELVIFPKEKTRLWYKVVNNARKKGNQQLMTPPHAMGIIKGDNTARIRMVPMSNGMMRMVTASYIPVVLFGEKCYIRTIPTHARIYGLILQLMSAEEKKERGTRPAI